ncbi:MAG: hypothetical protein D6731_04480, partial [Planctomycetota bacterium]
MNEGTGQPAKEPRTAGRRRLPRRRKLAYALVCLGLLGAGLEGYARLRGEPPLGVAPGGLFVAHPRLGYALRPGFRGRSHSGFGVWIQVSVNERGQRDAPLVLPKPPGVFRIACLGGSTTFGFGARRNDEAWPNRLEATYAGRGRVDVVNAGVHGWTLRQSLLNLDEGLRDAELDALVVLHAHNDLYENLDPAYAD